MDIKEKRGLVEESITLKISDFGKKLLYIKYGEESGLPAKKVGYFDVGKGGKSVLISYSYEPQVAMDLMDIEITRSDGQTTQQLLSLDWAQLSYGLRPLFLCSCCGKRCNSLYIAQHRHLYCRNCQNLTYESTRVKKTSLRGFAYPMLRFRRLKESEAKIKRISYNGRMTKKASALINWTEKIGSLVSHLRSVSMDSQRI